MSGAGVRTGIAVAVLRRLPTSIANTLVEDRGVREAYGLTIDPTLTLGESGVSVSRGMFYDAITKVLGPGCPSQVIKDDAGTSWTLDAQENAGDHQIVMRSGTQIIRLPSFWALSPVFENRLGALEHSLESVNLPADAATQWRTLLAKGPINHDDYVKLEADIDSTPVSVAARIVAEMASGTCAVSTLVPSSRTYFDRLLGPSAVTLEEYTAAGKRTTDQCIAWGRGEGLKLALLRSGHSSIVAGIDVQCLRGSELAEVLEWLVERGDTISQVGAIELALPILDIHEDLEPFIGQLAIQIRDDDPSDESGRFARLSDLIVFVGGELARTQSLRGEPPFWKRLGAIAQASLIERQAIDVGGDAAKFAMALRQSTGRPWWFEAMADLRIEPRWLPDFVSPSQLKHECVARIAQAAMVHGDKVRSSKLRDVLLGDTNSILSLLDPLLSCLPGPLEGGLRSQRAMPADVEELIERNLASDQLTSGSFAALVNSALIFEVGSELARLAAEALRRVKYQLRESLGGDVAYRLTYGLAIVAAVTRSHELSEEVRTLARVARRRPTPLLKVDSELEIALVAAAAHEDAMEWAIVLGDWMTEVAVELSDVSWAARLRADLRMMRVFVPDLLGPVARADAALASVTE